MSFATTFIPAHHENIRYYGRWDVRDPLHPGFSWPGVYLRLRFTGSHIGIRTSDSVNYYNVYIDNRLHGVFHGSTPGTNDYILAGSLDSTEHTLLLSRRNITFDTEYFIDGFLVDEGASLLDPPPDLPRKIELIGDSFTAAECNETTEEYLPWEERYPVTNIDKGFAVLIARHFNAEYVTTCRSGSGMVCDWQGMSEGSIPTRFDRTLMEVPTPKWDFSQWIPDVAVICLGLNDLTGLKDGDGNVSDKHSALFRKKYHEFLNTVRSVYPDTSIVAVAAFHEWIRSNVRQVVNEERQAGRKHIYYSQFDEFPDGYVGNGHPTVMTHKKMADQVIRDMESFHLFPDHKK